MKADLSLLVNKACRLVDAILKDGGASPLSSLAKEACLPQSTAYRIVNALIDNGLLIKTSTGRFFAGATLLRSARHVSPKRSISAISERLLMGLAAENNCVAHLGVFIDDMVTYLLKVGHDDIVPFTGNGTQLEAYCSAIGKVLLAARRECDLMRYLSDGAFIRLTDNTITDAVELRQHLIIVAEQGFAIDRDEIAYGLSCVAVPLRYTDGVVYAAISLAMPSYKLNEATLQHVISRLKAVATEIGDLAFGEDNLPTAQTIWRPDPPDLSVRELIHH